jgi:hypothetical protein
MNDKLNLSIKGYIKIYRDGKLVHEQPNTLTSNAFDILRRTVLGQSGAICQISVYKNSTLLASANITQITYSGTNKVLATAVFTEASFNDTFDEMGLENLTVPFSSVTGLSISKDNLSQIAIEWTLEFLITGLTP